MHELNVLVNYTKANWKIVSPEARDLFGINGTFASMYEFFVSFFPFILFLFFPPAILIMEIGSGQSSCTYALCIRLMIPLKRI